MSKTTRSAATVESVFLLEVPVRTELPIGTISIKLMVGPFSGIEAGTAWLSKVRGYLKIARVRRTVWSIDNGVPKKEVRFFGSARIDGQGRAVRIQKALCDSHAEGPDALCMVPGEDPEEFANTLQHIMLMRLGQYAV